MRNLNYIFTALIAASLAFASCTKEIDAPDGPVSESEFSHEPGSPIVFGVSTGYENEPQTKVEYSGETFNIVGPGIKYERLDWELDDRISMYCPQVSVPASKKAEYRISVVPTSETYMSKALLSAVGEGLKWGTESPNHYFYAFYPKLWDGSPSKFNKILSETLPEEGDRWNYKIKAEVPEIQAAGNKPLMTAITSIDRDSGRPVELPFFPAVNTFDINIVNARTEAVNLRKVKLVAPLENISGQYNICFFYSRHTEYDFKGSDLVQKNSVGYEFENGYSLAPNQSCDIRLYTLPVDIKHLTLVLDFDNESVNLELKKQNGDWIKFNKKQKYNIKDIKIPASVEKFNYTFTTNADTLLFWPFQINYPNQGRPSLNNLSVRSFRVNADGSKNYGVPWGYNSSIDWFNSMSNYHEGLAGNASGGGNIEFKRALKDFDPENNETHDLLKLDLYEKGYLTITDYDLSTKGGSTPRYTANCYVVRQRGSYKFPVVYGNGIQDDTINVYAFRARPSEETEIAFHNVLQEFVDGDDTEIATTQVYFNAAKVVLVWEDARGLIEELYLKTGNDNRQYVHFEIDKYIDHGNALIAVKNNAGTILWTWHIWVTDINFNCNTGEFLNFPLGYRPELEDFTEDVRSLELKQTDIKGKSKTIYNKVIKGKTSPSCLYYKSGVMRPLIPTYRLYSKSRSTEPGTRSKYITSLAKCYTADFYDNGGRYNTREFRLRKASGRKSLAQAISSPGEIFDLRLTYWNLWNNKCTQYYYYLYEPGVRKTVYDPCPVGYRMPTIGVSRTLANSIKDRFKMGGYRDNIPSVNGNTDFEFSVYNFAQRCELLNTSSREFYPPAAEGDPSDEAIIFPVRENIAAMP